MSYRVLLTDYGGRGQKIQSIKTLRSVLNVGLKEAKEWCDALDHGDPYPTIYESMSYKEADEILRRLSETDDLVVVMPLPEELPMPTPAEISLAIWIARELPVKPDDLRKIAQRISEGDDPVASLHRVANMIETA